MTIKDVVDKMARDAGMVPPVDRTQRTLADGSPITEDHRELRSNGQQKDYVVLSAEERTRGFVRPVRRTYVHAGIPEPTHLLRDLTADEQRRFNEDSPSSDENYVKYEEYPKGGSSGARGRFWTQAELDKVGKGCGVATTMSQSIAETYARDPHFYSGTFCVGCGSHFPVGENGEFVWDDGTRVGT